MVPYFICPIRDIGLKEAVELAEYIRDMGFYAGAGTGFLSETPSTISTCMYYTGLGSADDGEGVCTGQSA